MQTWSSIRWCFKTLWMGTQNSGMVQYWILTKMLQLFFNFICLFFFSADWYKDRLTDKQLDELENPPTTTTSKPKVKKGSSRRKHQKLQHREEEQPTEEWKTADNEWNERIKSVFFTLLVLEHSICINNFWLNYEEQKFFVW